MTNYEIVDKIKRSVDKLYSDAGDRYLFDCHVCERSLMFRFAHYLQLEFSDHFVDCEFNKMGFESHKSQLKMEPSRDGNGLKRMFADIIIHKRGELLEGNLVCLELKTSKRLISDDLVRLKNMTNLEGFISGLINYVYGYKLGVSIYLPVEKNNLEMKYFRNGEEIDEQVLRQAN
jgi:hypothetical protein